MRATLILGLFVSLTFNASAQLINGSFEDWDTVFKATYEAELTNIYKVQRPESGVSTGWKYSSKFGFTRTSDAVDGDFAIIIHNWYTTEQERLNYYGSIKDIPNALVGYYKFDNEELNGMMAFGTVEVVLFNELKDTIAFGDFRFDAASEYTFFKVEINQLKESTPDSVQIYFRNSYQKCSSTRVCNLLFLDSLAFNFTSIAASAESHLAEDHFKIYPNPTNEIINVDALDADMYIISIFDVFGNLRIRSEGRSVDVSYLPEGYYLLRITSKSNKGIEYYYKFIKEK